MKAAVLEEFEKPLVIKNVPEPICESDSAIVEVKACGICRSDWHAWRGDWGWIGFSPQLPRIMGHELCGVIVEVGKNVKGLQPGTRVVTPFNNCDGICPMCQSSLQNLCENLQVPGFSFDGGYGQYVSIPRADYNLIPLPESISFIDAASMGCRFMTSFHGLVDRAKVQPGEWIAVYGCGGIGLAAIHIASAIGARVIAITRSEEKLLKAQELGASFVVNAAKENPVEAVLEITKGGSHVAVDAVGEAVTCRNAIQSLKARGRLLQIGMTSQQEQGEIAIPIDLMIVKELSLLGSLGMPPIRYQAMISMVTDGKLKPGSLVTKTVDIEEASKIIVSMSDYATTGVNVINSWN
jgi:D-arabinose 1-dehydrogenase-like Zn-dependent alcohol dehydrogenase